MGSGKLFLVIGPSGAGKTTLVRALLSDSVFAKKIKRVVSYTTRSLRPTEQEGVDYHFINREEFKRKIERGFFLEWSAVYQAYYGSAYNEVCSVLEKGRSLIMVPDRKGALQILEKLPQARVIFVAPPSIEELRERLQGRGVNTFEQIEFRLKQAGQEMKAEETLPLAAYTLINDQFSVALEELAGYVYKELGG